MTILLGEVRVSPSIQLGRESECAVHGLTFVVVPSIKRNLIFVPKLVQQQMLVEFLGFALEDQGSHQRYIYLM